MDIPRAPVTVILPTHNHASTVDYAIRSVLEQSYENFVLVVIGDGIGDDTRDVIGPIVARDARVVLIDRPKSPRHAEGVRDEIIRSVNSSVIAYHGDDDLLLPHHLEHMLTVLSGSDFAHPLPIFVEPDESLSLIATDLERPECIDWHLGTNPRNAVSLTGVVHTRDSYIRLPHGWRETPSGRWTDHYMWSQYFAAGNFRGVTSRYATTVKLTAPTRVDWTADQRREEIKRWWERINSEEFQPWWNEQVQEVVFQSAVNSVLIGSHCDDVQRALNNTIEAQRVEIANMAPLLEEATRQRDAAVDILRAIEASKYWKAAERYRYIRAKLNRLLR